MKFFAKPTSNESVFGFIYFLLQLLIIPAIITVVNMMLPNPYPEAAENFIFFAVNFIFVTVIFRKFLLSNFRVLAERPWMVLRYAGIGFLIYMAGNWAFGLLVSLLVPDFSNINDAIIMEMVQDNYNLMTIGTVLLVPVAEECFYRGLIFRNLCDKSPLLGYILSMVFFSLAHVLGYVTVEDLGTLTICFLQYLPAGFALAWSYRRCGSIFAPILIHMTVNQIGMLLMR